MTMINRTSPQQSSGIIRVAVVLGVPLALGSIALRQSAAPVQPLAAVEISASQDMDSDGLSDRQELVLGTSITAADSDGDGFSDLEEFARHSDPLSNVDTPEQFCLSVALSARGGGGFNHVFAAVYAADGDFSTKRMSFGAAVQGRMAAFSNSDISRTSEIRTVDVSGAGRVFIVDRRISPRTLIRFGYSSFYGAVGRRGAANRFEAAAVVDLQTIDGYTTLVRTDYAQSAWFDDGISLAPVNAGSAHVPIPASGGSGDDDSTAGAACVQQSAPVGSSGSILTRQVTSAACEDGWDSFCSGGCASSAGSTFDTVDPISLVGG